jgi:RNA polymerase sigma factor (sigma-70 family)
MNLPQLQPLREWYGSTHMQVDQELCGAWKRGDRKAAEQLIERHYDSVTGFFRTKAGAHADDLVQRTFLRCAEGIGGYREESPFRAFLFGIARNVLLEHIRGRARDGQTPDLHTSSIIDLQPGVATLVSKHAEQRLLVSALQRIPVELQIALELFYWEELSIDELALVLDVPAGTVKSRLHRARVLLREVMETLPSSQEEKESLRSKLAHWLAEVREELPPQSRPA